MTRKVHYLAGKQQSNADRLEAAYQKAHGEQRPFLERNSGKLLAMCLVGLVTLGVASWGWPLFYDWLIGYVGVDVD